jgi:hypothetical protein
MRNASRATRRCSNGVWPPRPSIGRLTSGAGSRDVFPCAPLVDGTLDLVNCPRQRCLRPRPGATFAHRHDGRDGSRTRMWAPTPPRQKSLIKQTGLLRRAVICRRWLDDRRPDRRTVFIDPHGLEAAACPLSLLDIRHTALRFHNWPKTARLAARFRLGSIWDKSASSSVTKASGG